jgi:signal recognition particle receptor subunit beta
MVQFDYARREMTVKLVYYGPAMSGKTTNLQQIHQQISDRARGRLMTLDTRDDRTLFFDLLPIALGQVGGLKLRLRLFTVPGQVMHNSTRKIVLQGADGVAFIADSQVAEIRANNESYTNLKANLREQGIEWTGFPAVIQFNKRDLPNVRSDDEIAALARAGPEPIYRAVALRGDGVLETFFGLLQLTWSALDQSLELKAKFGLDVDALCDAVHRQLGIDPGALATRVAPPGVR